MRRLTSKSYLARHHHLRRTWLFRDGFFATLTYAEQIDLHRYYSPAVDESDERHLAHRTWISQQDLSLPQRAGRAYAKLIAGGSDGRVISASRRGRRLTVGVVALPYPDVRRIARALIDMDRTRAATSDRDDHAA